jgi:hypothetical protein
MGLGHEFHGGHGGEEFAQVERVFAAVFDDQSTHGNSKEISW